MPKVSIFSFCKNAAPTIRRSVESVLKLDHDDFEFVIQDGASTDGTREIIESYKDPRIQLVSEPDSCAQEGFFRALKRCQGEIIGSCLSDEEILPHAIRWALEGFQKNPNAIALYGDSYNTDENGNILSTYRPHFPFTLDRYLLHEVVPTFASSFFKRDAMERADLHTHSWRMGGGEFEFWTKVSMQGDVAYEPGVVAKFAIRENQLSRTREVHNKLIFDRAKVITQLFDVPDFVSQISISKESVLAGLFLWGAQISNDIGAYEDAQNFIRKALPYKPSAMRLRELAGDCCNHALIMLKKKRYEDALKSVASASLAGGDFPDLYFLKATAEIELDKKEEAKKSLAEHLKIKPNDSVASQMLANLG